MDYKHKVDFWCFGVLEHHPHLAYKGGSKSTFYELDLDKLTLEDLCDMYHDVGGTKEHVKFYFKIPGQQLDTGLWLINGTNLGVDYAIRDIQRYYTGVDIPIQFYVEEVDESDVLSLRYNMMVLPSSIGGKNYKTEPHLFLSPDFSWVEFLTHGDENGIAGNGGVSEQIDKMPGQEVGEIPIKVVERVTYECDDEGVVGEDFSHGAHKTRPLSNKKTKSSHKRAYAQPISNKKKASQSSYPSRIKNHASQPSRTKTPDLQPIVNSNDENYKTSEGESELYDNNDYVVESDAASVELEDVECSDDDNIFAVKNLTKPQLVQILREMARKEKAPIREPSKPHVVDEEDWYSDAHEDEELYSLSDSDGGTRPKFTHYREGQNMKTFEFSKGMKFANAQEFREVLRDWAVRKGYELEFKKNEGTRIRAKFTDKACTWVILASIPQGSNTFQVKTLEGVHRCVRKDRNNLAHKKYLVKRMLNVIRSTPIIKISDLKRKIKEKVTVDVNKWMAIKVRNDALEILRGAFVFQFAETVIAYNPGSSVYVIPVQDSNPPVFEKMYFCLNAMKKGFLEGCRPIIGLDGCFLKTPYGGQLLVAVARDGNDNMWPIALAVVSVENRENWTWFIDTLLEDIGGKNSNWWTFMSDRQKGLIEALKELVPNCEHRFCLRHMYDNFKKKFKQPELKGAFWKAASCANKHDLEDELKSIEKVDPKKSDDVETAAEWLRKIPFEHWCRAYFSSNAKCDSLTNNMSESFNNYILEARDKPIITMWEWIRVRLMERLQIKREGMEKYIGTLCPNLVKKLNKISEKATYCFVRPSTTFRFEVHEYMDHFLVDLEKRTCSCGMYQLTGYPCCHAFACVSYRRVDIDEYVDDVYKKDAYMKVYAFNINGVPGHKHYTPSGLASLEPPKIKKKKGRPAKERRKGPDELRSTSTRVGLTHTCQKCFQTGHNATSCWKEPQPMSKYYITKENQGPNGTASQHPSQATREEHPSITHVLPQNVVNSSLVQPVTQEQPALAENGLVYQEKSSDALLGKGKKSGTTSKNNASTSKRKKNMTEREVVEKIKERSRKRRDGQS